MPEAGAYTRSATEGVASWMDVLEGAGRQPSGPLFVPDPLRRNRVRKRPNRIRADDRPLRTTLLHELELALADRCGIHCRSAECGGRRRLVFAISGDSE